MPETTSSQFERMFNNLFELIRDMTSSVNTMSSEVGKHRASVNEAIQIMRDRPCFTKVAEEKIREISDKSVSSIEMAANTVTTENIVSREVYTKEHVASLSASNSRLTKLLYSIFYTLVAVNTSVFVMIIYFVHKNPRIWDIIEKLIVK